MLEKITLLSTDTVFRRSPVPSSTKKTCLYQRADAEHLVKQSAGSLTENLVQKSGESGPEIWSKNLIEKCEPLLKIFAGQGRISSL